MPRMRLHIYISMVYLVVRGDEGEDFDGLR